MQAGAEGSAQGKKRWGALRAFIPDFAHGAVFVCVWVELTEIFGRRS